MGPYSTHSFWLLDRDGRIRFREVSLEMHVPFGKVEQAQAEPLGALGEAQPAGGVLPVRR